MEREIVKTYAGVWNTPLKIYSFQNFKLPVPIVPRDLIYFVSGCGVVFILSSVLPLSGTPSILRYGLVPYLIMKFLTKIKLDGKKPHKFFWGMILYFIASKKYENFKSVNIPEKFQFKSPIIQKREV